MAGPVVCVGGSAGALRRGLAAPCEQLRPAAARGRGGRRGVDLGGTDSQEAYETGRGVKRIGYRGGAVGRDRGPKLAGYLGDEHVAGGDPAGIQRRQPGDRRGVVRIGPPDRDLLGRAVYERVTCVEVMYHYICP